MSFTTKLTQSIAISAIAVSTVAVVFSDSAYALSLTQTNGVTTQATDATTINFNGLSGAVPSSATGIGPNPGQVTIQRLSGVAQFLGNQGTVPSGATPPYLNIGGGPGSTFGLQGGSVAFNFTNQLNYFGLYWGSLDIIPSNANIVSFFRGATQVGSFTGFDVATQLAGFQAGQSQYINFFSNGANEYFDQVVLTNPGLAAFEVDNVAYRAIPTPALLPGLVAMGFGVIRKRKAEAKANAEV